MGIRTSSMVFALALVSLGAVVVSQSAVTIPQASGPMFGQALSLESLDSVKSQHLDKKISVSFREASIQDILKELSKHGVSFVADSSSFQGVRLTLNFQDVTVREALESVGEIVDAKWERRGNVYTMKQAGRPGRIVEGVPFEERTTAPRSDVNARDLYERGFQEYGPRSTAPRADRSVRTLRPDAVAPLAERRVRTTTPDAIAPLAERTTRPRVRVDVAPQAGRPMTEQEHRAFMKEMESMQKELHQHLGPQFHEHLNQMLKGMPMGKDWEKMSPQERARWEADMEKFGQHWERFGEEFGKKWEGRFEGFDEKKMTPQQRAELEKMFEGFGEEWSKWGESFGKNMQLWGEQFGKNWEGEFKKFDGQKMREMTPKERAEFEKEMQKFHKEMEQWQKEFSKDMQKWERDMKVFQLDKDGKMRELNRAELEKMHGHMRELHRLEGLKLPEGRVFVAPGREMTTQERAKMERELQAARKSMAEAHAKMREEVRTTTPRAPIAPRQPDGARALTAPRVHSVSDLKKLMGSISKAQWEKHEKQGHLKVSDLTPEQKKMLGGMSFDGEISISISVDSKKLTIKS